MFKSHEVIIHLYKKRQRNKDRQGEGLLLHNSSKERNRSASSGLEPDSYMESFGKQPMKCCFEFQQMLEDIIKVFLIER